VTIVHKPFFTWTQVSTNDSTQALNEEDTLTFNTGDEEAFTGHESFHESL
jgi:hypothetical protein